MPLWCIPLLLTLVSSAGARVLPSEVDLRAAYCLPVVEDLIRVLAAPSPFPSPPDVQAELDAGVREGQEVLYRLRRYLHPRLLRLDLSSLLATRQAGEQDLRQAEGYDQTCKVTCSQRHQKYLAQAACRDQCTAANPYRQRFKPCFDLTWLPY
jgi:hypothetical protein